MSKLLKNFIGIDISKSWFDAALVVSDNQSQISHRQFSQKPDGFKMMLDWLNKQGVALDEQTLFCMEYTGLYNTGLVEFLSGLGAKVWVEMALRIKKAGGFERGTDDKLAAVKIANYALRHQEQAKLWKPLDSNLEKLKNFIGQRDRIIVAMNQLKVPVKEMMEIGSEKEAKILEKLQKPAINGLQKAKENIEVLIEKTVRLDEQLNAKVNLVQSIDGIGPVTAIALLVFTKGFTAFDNAKQLACYCGVVPFAKSSGSSVRYKPSVSPFANKKLKKLLHMCALSAISNNKELKAYFERKVAEGKNKMCVINAVRNKLLQRVFAVVRDNRLFEENYTRRCA